jgi:predicted transcriptional regulator
MPTTVHIPGQLLKAVDRRARALKISRNRLIVQALAREVSPSSAWSPEFLDRLRQTDAAVAEAVDDLVGAIAERRRSKRPLSL